MPLLSAREATGTVRVLDSQSYSDTAASGTGGVGLTKDAYTAMNEIVSKKRATLDAIEERIESTFIPVGDGRLHRPFQVDAHGREIPAGSLKLPIQAQALAHAAAMGEIRSRVPEATGDSARFFPPVAYGKLQGHLNPSAAVDLHSVVFEIQQSARRIFTSGQQVSLSKMISEWLTMIDDVIEAATEAEQDLARVIGDINAERQAIWSTVGGVLGAVLTYSVPPPAGAIVGAIIMSVFTEDTWLKAVASGAKLGVQANKPGSPSATLGPYEIQTMYGQEKLTDYKDWFATIGGSSSCLGKSAREVVDKVNKKTLRHLTDMPAPPKAQAKDAVQVIRVQCNEKMQSILRAVGEEISDFINTQSGPASVVQASWEYQESSIASKAKIMPEYQRATFVKDSIREGALLYLNTTAHEIMVTLAERSKPRSNRFSFDKKSVKKELELLLWANYLSTAALKESKATSLVGGKAPQADDEDYFAYHYGTIKKLVWRNQLETKLNDLGITRHYPPRFRVPFAGRSADYEQAIRAWRPPMPTGPWTTVPYQEGGNNAKGRLAAWAVEYVKRPPTDLYKAILG
ncbi:MAG TPA: hypothetical protein VHZ07_23535 [Bryobacteraceae bacterium]|nr:hypothetical protein [Bryobacteraceae bacterium]